MERDNSSRTTSPRKTQDTFQVISFGSGLPVWQIDSLGDALLAALIGLMLWPVTLHINNGLAWVHAKLAKLMLSINPWESELRSSGAEVETEA